MKPHYRKYYEQYLQIKLDRKFVVHHIDSNRSNNDILNLVAIPTKLHVNYHQTKFKFDEAVLEITNSMYFYGIHKAKFNKIINEFIDIKNELSKYIADRDCKLIEIS